MHRRRWDEPADTVAASLPRAGVAAAIPSARPLLSSTGSSLPQQPVLATSNDGPTFAASGVRADTRERRAKDYSDLIANASSQLKRAVGQDQGPK